MRPLSCPIIEKIHGQEIKFLALVLFCAIALAAPSYAQNPVVPGRFAQGFIDNGGFSADAGDPYALSYSNGAVTPTGGLFSGGLFRGGVLARLNPNNQVPPLLPGVRHHIGNRLYLSGEYLLWDVDGMRAPALVTTSPSGTPDTISGVLGENGTRVLFGGELNEGTANGFRFGGGFWLGSARRVGIEFEYFQLEDLNDGYLGSSQGIPILARPSFDIVAGQETAQLIAYPGRVSGNIRIDSESSFRSFLIGGRIALCHVPEDFCHQCGTPDRTDLIIGYRDLQLDDSLIARENVESQLTNFPGSLSVTDHFDTENHFRGLQLGLVHRRHLRRIWVESLLRVAIGNNEQTLRINGNNRAVESGVVEDSLGGYLAQRTNIGTFTRDEFSMVPEVGLKFGWQITRALNATIGYSAVFFPNVVRAAEQIDTDLNPGLFSPEQNPLVGALRPRILWVESSYLAHGLSFGGELQF